MQIYGEKAVRICARPGGAWWICMGKGSDAIVLLYVIQGMCMRVARYCV